MATKKKTAQVNRERTIAKRVARVEAQRKATKKRAVRAKPATKATGSGAGGEFEHPDKVFLDKAPEKPVVLPPPINGKKRTSKDLFLTAYGVMGTLRAAAEAAGISRRTHYNWLKQDEVYRLAFEDAEADFRDRVTEEIIRRGMKGVEEPVIYKGKLQFVPLRDADGALERDKSGKVIMVPLTVRKFSDPLASMEGGARDPRYRKNFQVEHGGSGGGPIEVRIKYVDSDGDGRPAPNTT